MAEAKELLANLDASTRRYRKTEAAHEQARAEVLANALDALRAGVRPTDVVEHSPFTAAYIRKLARDNGIEPAKKGGKKEPTDG